MGLSPPVTPVPGGLCAVHRVAVTPHARKKIGKSGQLFLQSIPGSDRNSSPHLATQPRALSCPPHCPHSWAGTELCHLPQTIVALSSRASPTHSCMHVHTHSHTRTCITLTRAHTRRHRHAHSRTSRCTHPHSPATATCTCTHRFPPPHHLFSAPQPGLTPSGGPSPPTSLRGKTKALTGARQAPRGLCPPCSRAGPLTASAPSLPLCRLLPAWSAPPSPPHLLTSPLPRLQSSSRPDSEFLPQRSPPASITYLLVSACPPPQNTYQVRTRMFVSSPAVPLWRMVPGTWMPSANIC